MTEWISVRERLPSPEEKFYIAVIFSPVFTPPKIAYWDGTNFVDMHQKFYTPLAVTHWTSLPEPPK